ncbi:hypothetical protein MHC_03920 [Mycoplasma haemocanis str. Illinois]|uniref:Uncharacterized protein n=1 Tax=Mycoplasma haemocanis (strain Illinois) TaxID=1111676 RepID=H6N7M0_MYCHN|nr:hypothetical protein [Mycoplasma haemocanis]AEW45642.1 hypothetical protein MHC_03920 [Mycoplasma haemocanis str. Illinois]
MKGLTIKALAGLGTAGATGTIAITTWYLSRPKDVKAKLKSEGLKLVGDSVRAWRAIFLTHKGNAEFIRFAGILESDSDKEAGSKVMFSCKQILNVASGDENYEDFLSKARSYCTVPQFKTIETKILFSDKEPSSVDRDWKDSFVLNKEDPSFIEKVKKSSQAGTSFDSSTSTDIAKDVVKKFCEALKVKFPESQDVLDYERYCLQTPTNIEAFFEKQGYYLVKDGSWGSKFDSIKSTDSSLFDEIKKGTALSSSSDGTQGGPKLKEWCDLEKVKEINAISDLKKIKSRCFN